jgi:tRNA(adenine34) deaminase
MHDSADVRWMREALAEAEAAAAAGDVPVGAVIVDAGGSLVGRGRNGREADQDPTGHAEIYALRRAATALGRWRLEGATVYVTLEPCPMCAGALVNARIARLVYGCADPKAGAVDTLFSIGQDSRLNHRFNVERGVLEEECGEALRRFFAAIRAECARRRAPSVAFDEAAMASGAPAGEASAESSGSLERPTTAGEVG